MSFAFLVSLSALFHTAAAWFYHEIVNAQHRGDLVHILNKLQLVHNAAEIGVWHAGFARHNLQHWLGRKYFMIDTWQHRGNDSSRDKNSMSEEQHKRDYVIAKNATAPWLLDGKAEIIRGFAEAAVHNFPDHFFDFIYIDANHEYKSVLRDMRMWWPKLAPGGMLAGDDFADMYDTFYKLPTAKIWKWGVKSAVARFSREVGSPFFLTFADRQHTSTENSPLSSSEWLDNPRDKRMLNIPPNELVRRQEFFPAWYLFK